MIAAMSRSLVLVLVVLCACSGEKALPLVATSLPVREATAGKRFRRLDAASSGLSFQNSLRPENVVAYVYMGAGVAAGDYDGNGLPDLYFVSQDGPNKLFRQVAPLRFEDVTLSAGGLDGGDAWGSAATFADIDNDGDLDLYVCNLESPNLLYLNQGDGTFRESAGIFGLGVVAASTGAAFADYDNDGDLDLYLLTNRVLKPTLPAEIVKGMSLPKDLQKTRAELFPPMPEFERKGQDLIVPKGHEDWYFTLPGHGQPFLAGQRDRLFRNDGYANWREVGVEAGIRDQGNGLSVVWWDYDDDGWLDLYVANDFQSPDHLYHNRRDGTFEDVTAKALPHTAFFGMGADFGDIDNDGRLDLCVADMSSTTHYMGKMLMGSMDQHRWFLMNARPQQYMRNALYLNTGTDRFAEAAWLAGLASTDWTWAVRFADLDDDGRLDFYATNGIPVFADNPDIGERFDRLWRDGQQQQALELFRSMPRVDEKNVARRNDGNLHFTDVGAEWGLDEIGVSHGAVVCDLDRDGDLDVVTNNLNAEASVFINGTHDAHRLTVSLRGARSNRHGVGSRITVVAGGVTQTRLVSLTRGYMSAGEAIEHFGLGAAARVERLTVRWPGGREQSFTDVAADQALVVHEADAASDLASPPVAPATWFQAMPASSVRHRERDFDDFALQPLLPQRLSRSGPGLAIGDADGDQRDDVWVGGAAGQAGSLLLARGEAFELQPGPWTADAESEDMGACWLDYDGDGDLDLFVASGGIEAGERTEAYRDRLYRNDGGGRFVRDVDALPDLRDSSSCVAAADFDHDGDLDLMVGTAVLPGRFPGSGPSRLLRNDRGRFVDVTASLAPALLAAGMVRSACWTDVDGDGWLDLVVAAEWQPLRVLGNDRGERFVDRTEALGLAAWQGQWHGIAAADLDGDGDTDLVATNLGHNTKYKASAEKPLRLYGRDFDGNGSFDVIESKSVGKDELPVRGLSCSSQAMPFVRTKFPTYDAFARASLGQIYGSDELAQGVVLTCNELRHCVFENRGSSFHAHPLPSAAQISAAFGIAVLDADHDGVLDLALAHNSFAPEPETGRFDGGLGILLRGRGGMQFEPIGPATSGIVMPEDTKALATIDLDGNGALDLLATTNDGPLRQFRGRSRPGLAVRLRGPKGNPTGIGARLELPGQSVREISAGGSYLTQSEALVRFAPAAVGAVLRVRWPDGHVTELTLTESHGALTVTR
jgi:enediyne biosynthesis protein E4